MRVGIIAGEASGDRLAAGLIAALRAHDPALVCEGISGPAMLAAGCRPLHSIDRLSIMGIAEVLRRYRDLRSLQHEMIAHFLAVRPDVFIGVDAPDFVLGIAAALRRAGILTVQYVSPTVWAWRPGRMQRVAAAVDLLLAILPFEPALYQGSGARVEYVGHPLADEIVATADSRGAARAALGVAVDGRYLAVLPGSRSQELQRHTALFLRTAAACQALRPALQILCAPVDASARQAIEAIRAQVVPALALRYFTGAARSVLAASDIALAASGTVTLEGLLCGCPLVVAYRVNWLSFAILRLLVRTRYIALPNILAGESLVPEFVQGRMQIEPMTAALLDWLDQPARVERYRAAGSHWHGVLRLGASERAATAVAALVHGR